MRYTLSQGDDPRSTLVVDTCVRIDEQALAELRRFMFEYSCSSGLLFDDSECVVLRDVFDDMSAASVHEDARIPTQDLLATLGPHNVGSLDVRVGQWLRLLTASWRSAVPTEPASAQELVYDVAPAASGATIHAWAVAA